MLPLYDFCLFNNEFEMLDLRLRYMQNFVLRFFVCELDQTYQGAAKEYHSEKFLSKYKIGQELVDAGRLTFVQIANIAEYSYFAIEHGHRIAFTRWVVENIDHDFLGLLCDCDEIVNEAVINSLDLVEESANLDFEMFYFAADNHSQKQSWSYPKIFRSHLLRTTSFQELRMSAPGTTIADMGWHFSSFGGHMQVADKIKSFSHTEYNHSEFSNKWGMLWRIKRRQDYLGRPEFPCKEYDIANFPDKLEELIIGKPNFKSLKSLFGTFEEILVHDLVGDHKEVARNGIVPDENFSGVKEIYPGVSVELYVLYHVACIGEWKDVVMEQLDVLRSSGLLRLSVVLIGSLADRDWLIMSAEDYGLNLLIECHFQDLENYEFPAMVLIEKWCENHPDGYALYFHTKGVSRPGDTIRKSWRRLMGKYVIEGWRDNCLALQDGCDLIGVNWRNLEKFPHFTGNFFLARASYINSLVPFADYFERFLDERGTYHPRMAAEFWLGSSHSPPRLLSHVSVNEDMTSFLYWDKYRSLLPPGGGWLIGTSSIRVDIRYACVGHGTIGLRGELGYEGLLVSHPTKLDLQISAHADSTLTIYISAMLRIHGFLNGTASSCGGAIFHVDGIHLGTVYHGHDVTDGLVILPGLHELKITSLAGINFCHTVWGMEYL